MTMFLIRDDDPNATTDPEQLAAGYAPLLDAGVPIVFATIPEVALDTRAPNGEREKFLHPDTPDSAECVRMLPETPLAQWMRAHARDVDVFLHGLTHQRVRGGTEFGSLTREEAAARLDAGKLILRTALDRDPVAFVPPWDALSPDSLRAAADRFEMVSTGWVERRLLPMSAWPSHAVERLRRREALRVGSSWVVRHRGGKIHGRTAPDEVPYILDQVAQGADVAVVVLHHWMFWGGRGPHPTICALARALRGREFGNVRAAIQTLSARRTFGRAA